MEVQVIVPPATHLPLPCPPPLSFQALDAIKVWEEKSNGKGKSPSVSYSIVV